MPQWLSEYLYDLSPAEYNFFTLALFIGAIYSVYKIYQIHQRYRFIQDTATSRIASAAQGYVELKGLAELLPESNITSPFSQRKCVWYQCKIDVKQTTGKRSHWIEESNRISEEIFLIKDDTGACIVIPEDALVIASHQRVWYGNALQASHLNAKSSGFSSLIGLGNYRFTEKMIFVADPLYVIGDFESVRKNINEQSIQKQEWSKIKQHAEMKVMQQHQQAVINTIRKPNEKNHPFVISTISEGELLRNKRLSLTLYVMLFLVMLTVLISMINLPNK
jgi:hypothetical protein